MSDVETHFGKMKKIDFKMKSMPFKNKVIILESLGYVIDAYNEDGSYFDCENLIYVKSSGNFYKILEDISVDNEEFNELYPQKDGTLQFATSFYNGGTGLSEMLEESLETYEKKMSKVKGYAYER
jgi:hypothetical protein